MTGLKYVVILLGVMILFATTALVVLVVKKSSRPPAMIAADGGDGQYITSYSVGNNIAVVTGKGATKTITIYDGSRLKELARLVIAP